MKKISYFKSHIITPICLINFNFQLGDDIIEPKAIFIAYKGTNTAVNFTKLYWSSSSLTLINTSWLIKIWGFTVFKTELRIVG